MKTLKYLLFFAIVVIAFLACSKENDSSTTRTVKVLLTDNPMDAEEVNVDIKSVRLKQGDDDDNDDNDDDDNGWTSIDTKDTIYNLLSLQNDVNVLLASGPFPFEHLEEVRLILGENNTIKIDGKVYPLKVPSGSASGLKIKVDRDLSEGENEIIIDFDAALSVHETGNGKYMLRPVIRLK
jgi:hypothetical protein